MNYVGLKSSLRNLNLRYVYFMSQYFKLGKTITFEIVLCIYLEL